MWRFVIQCSNHLGIEPLWPSELPWWHLARSQSEDISLQSISGPIFFTLLIQFLGSPESYGKLLQKAPKMACSIMFRKLVISSLHPGPVSPAITIFKDVLHSPKIDRLQACEIFSQLYFSIASRLFILSCLEPCSMSLPVQGRILWLLSKNSSMISYWPHVLLLMSL